MNDIYMERYNINGCLFVYSLIQFAMIVYFPYNLYLCTELEQTVN